VQAFIGNPSGSTAIPLLSGWREYGLAINASGQVVGSGINPLGAYQAFIGITSGSTAILPPSGWTGANGDAINASGQVAGYGTNSSGNSQAFIGSTAIPLPSGWTSAIGEGINASGQVTGYGNNGSTNQAFIGSTAIPLPIGWTTAEGLAINTSGQVAGFGNNGSANQAFIFTSSGNTAIPLPTGVSSVTVTEQSLNDSGVVVGSSSYGTQVGWIWDASDGTQLLNNLVPSGWVISNAISISDSGLILAQGSFDGGATEYVELSPAASSSTPEPGTCLLAGAGLLLLAFARRTASRRCRLPR
jgi:hypothetical protein